MAGQAAFGYRIPDQGYKPASGEAVMIRLIAFVVCIAASLTAGVVTSSAMTIEKIVSPSGIEAWLVQEKAVPLVTLNYAFHGGASQDDADKAGTANLAAALLDEGEGELDRAESHTTIEKQGSELIL